MSDEFEWDDVDFSSLEDPTADAIGSLVVNFAYFNSIQSKSPRTSR